jgi:predicted nucleotidyltransferase
MVLSQHKKEIIKKYFAGKPIKKAFVFGSYARNEANELSDLDILVELDNNNPVGMQFFRYKNELEKLLHLKIDLVLSDGLSPLVEELIEKDKLLIYEN